MQSATQIEPNTVSQWLHALSPPPPPVLLARLVDLLEPYGGESVSRVPDICVDVGEELLTSLLASGSTSRACALDLLAVDALVTYAFQAAADAPEQFEARAASAMSRIAALPFAHTT